MDFLCSLKQRSCARPPAILSGSSLPLSGPAAPQPPDPRMAAMEAEQAVLQGCQQVHGAVPTAQSIGSTTPQGPECHRDRQQQEQEQIAKSASQHGAGKPKQSLAATPSHRLPAAPASTSHLQGLSSQSCYLQPSQYPTRPKFSVFHLCSKKQSQHRKCQGQQKHLFRNRMDGERTAHRPKQGKARAGQGQYARAVVYSWLVLLMTLCNGAPQCHISIRCPLKPHSTEEMEHTQQQVSPAPSSPRWRKQHTEPQLLPAVLGCHQAERLLVQGDTWSSETQLCPAKITAARQTVWLCMLHTAPLPALLPSQGTIIVTEPAPPSNAACL